MGEKSKKQLEDQITHILTTSEFAAVKTMLEKDHAIDCLFLLILDKGKWKKAKTYMNNHNLTLSDGTYRSRMIEITQKGFAKAEALDPLKKQYKITKKGEKLALALLTLLENV
ncbi:MAG: HAD hydrolase family protein [Candidatus Bathyarchaeota archaeon]|nr:MAG: HAD hydrolase family protein [Candidatus Bathyarchaeota archaeon]